MFPDGLAAVILGYIGSSSKVPEGDLLYCRFVLYVGARIISGPKEYQGNDDLTVVSCTPCIV